MVDDGRRAKPPFSVNGSTGDLLATLPDVWRYGVSGRTCWPGVSISWFGDIARLICNFCVSVAVLKFV